MANSVLLLLSGPMQSWGTQSLYEVRDTAREPSKSAVIGLLCAALGRPRWQNVSDLAALRMGVRADREGRLEHDFQTIQTIASDGSVEGTQVSRRYYLADATFLAGLEGPLEVLSELQAALQRPRWALCLGRRAFPPARPVWLEHGLRCGQAVEEALTNYPWLGTGERPTHLRLVLEDVQGAETRADVPLSFSERRFAMRRVRTLFLPVPPAHEEVN